VEEPYEKLKAFTRGQTVTQENMQQFVDGLDGIPQAAKRELAQLMPKTYVGNAAQQARDISRQISDLSRSK